MRAIDSRIRRLQQRLCPDEGQEQRIWIMRIVSNDYAGPKLALGEDKCIDILRECGFLPKTRWLVLSFRGIPDGLNAKELERYLRTNGAQICGQGGDQKRDRPEEGNRPGDNNWSNQAQIASDCVRC